MEFKGLKEHEAFQLLMKVADITPPWDPPTEVAGNEITKTLGYLALAVISAGNAIYKKVCHITEYLRFFSTPPGESPRKERLVFYRRY
jgi:hypothetical protein